MRATSGPLAPLPLPYPAEWLALPVSEAGFNLRVVALLREKGVATVADIVALTADDLDELSEGPRYRYLVLLMLYTLAGRFRMTLADGLYVDWIYERDFAPLVSAAAS